jgi:chromosome segregation ATPase
MAEFTPQQAAQALEVLQEWDKENRARAQMGQVLKIYQAALKELAELDKTKAATQADIDRLAKIGASYQHKNEEYDADFKAFVKEKEKAKDDLKQTIAELNREAEGKRKEIAALEQQYEAKKNALFAETKKIEAKHNEVAKAFEDFKVSHKLA